LKLPAGELHAGDPLLLEVDVKNTSDKAGDEVVELYVNFPKLPGTPLRALRGFTRVHVEAGKSRHVELTLQPRDLSYVNESGDRMVGEGDYVITVGGGQPNTKASHADADLSIRGEQKLPE
jgi:beta-glucosidase